MVQEQTSKLDFQDGGFECHYEFPINTILGIFISTGRPFATS